MEQTARLVASSSRRSLTILTYLQLLLLKLANLILFTANCSHGCYPLKRNLQSSQIAYVSPLIPAGILTNNGHIYSRTKAFHKICGKKSATTHRNAPLNPVQGHLRMFCLECCKAACVRVLLQKSSIEALRENVSVKIQMETDIFVSVKSKLIAWRLSTDH